MASRFSEWMTRHWQRLALGVGAVCLLVFAYGPALTRGPFGINDDYYFLYRVHERVFDPAHNEIMGMGRPINAWEDQIAYGLCDGMVARLVWLRAFAVLGIGLLAWTLFATLKRLRYPAGFAAAVAGFATLTPACGVYAGWAATAFVPSALIMALLAGRLLIGRGGWRRDLAAGGLIFAACATWQAAAPLAMFPALADAWRQTEDDPPDDANARPWWRPWVVGGLAVAAYGISCGLMARFLTVSAGGVARLAVANDWKIKAHLLVDLLRSGVTSWARLQAGRWEWTVGALTVVACLAALVVWRDRRMRWSATGRRLGLAVVMVVLSVAPLLAAREDNAALRSLPCLYVVVFFLGLYGARRCLHRCPRWATISLTLGGVILTAGAARYHVWHGLVEPSTREYVGLRDQVRRQFPAGAPAKLVYLVPPYTLLADGWLTPCQEYGLLTSTFWWTTRPFLILLFTDASPQPLEKWPDLTVSYREADNPGVPVLDSLPVLLREPGEWRDDPRWGRVRAFRGGWLYSPWFGYFYVRNFPLVWHHILGNLWVTSAEKDGGELWFYHAGVGQFYTKAGTFPRLLLGETQHWVFVTDAGPLQTWLIDSQDGRAWPYPP